MIAHFIRRELDHIVNSHCDFSRITLISFDEKGVSLHPNHIDVHFGLRKFVEEDRERLTQIGVQAKVLVSYSTCKQDNRFHLRKDSSKTPDLKFIGPLVYLELFFDEESYVNEILTKTYQCMLDHSSQFKW